MKRVGIIGAGASGMACAIMLKRLDSKIDVSIFESNDRVGKKLFVTGNGRCNISNVNPLLKNYHGDPEFAIKVINKFDFEKQSNFFHSIGVPIIVENDGKAFPMSLQAGSVVDALRFALDDLGIIVKTNTPVTNIIKHKNGYSVVSKNGSQDFDAIVIATGGKASVKNFDDFGYRTLKAFGHKIENISPSLVQIKTDTDIVKQLKGVKINGTATIETDKNIRSEYGEILFCDYGLSGPPIIQLSRYASPGKSISVDALPNMTTEDIAKELKYRVNSFPERPVSELFTGFLNKRLGQVVAKICKININSTVKCLSFTDISKLSNTLKSLTFNILGTNGFENAQVTAGGAQTTQFFDSLMSKKSKGMFAIGEVLNVDGDCGGYNLAFAWSSANVAANGIYNFLCTED